MAVLAVSAAGLLARPAVASPIRSHHLIVVSNVDSLGPAWARFLEGGIPLWEVRKPPRFPSGLVLPESQGVLVDTPFVDYLLWRRSLDPTRFDHYHPFIGPLLGQGLTPPTSTHSSVATPRGGTPRSGLGDDHPANPQPQQGVPEPGTLSVALVLIGAGYAWQRRNVRRAGSGR